MVKSIEKKAKMAKAEKKYLEKGWRGENTSGISNGGRSQAMAETMATINRNSAQRKGD